ncbi:MAG: DUF1273 family protein [Clostridia bacterium]|nr:DUF1273 family protein [Clostridia bacterium]
MKKAVCFIGHRKIDDTTELRKRLCGILRELIDNGMTDFIFGGRSAFDDLCYELVTELKKEYPEIRRINFRCDHEDTDDYTMQFLIKGYEESICPKGVGKAGRASYVKRNRAMIFESDVCVFYYDENYLPSRRKNSRRDLCDYQPKSGTALAFQYAKSKKKTIINCFADI